MYFCMFMTIFSEQIKLWERELEMVTQNVKLSNALKVGERRVVTLESIILKSNLKLGGLNYERLGWNLAARRGKRLDPSWSSFPRNWSAPSVIGYAANFKANRFDTVGDYLFQSSRREGNLYDKRSVRGLLQHCTHSRDTPSSATLSALGAKNIKTVFIVAQKEHNVRLVLDRIERSRKPTDQIITLEL
ncbi:unnamed protein product [Cylicocyclus nassatus]|uniref:Uncharacterized protein n=1 Tax=Cylicocyclus nassatus TaxID=53992 RepID=A0AA36MIB0_CYLNA|nr:unnamed protein product [Cylicocyclus nassatus]